MADDDQPVKVRDARELVLLCLKSSLAGMHEQQKPQHGQHAPSFTTLSDPRSTLEESMAHGYGYGGQFVRVDCPYAAPMLYARLHATPIFHRDISAPFLPNARSSCLAHKAPEVLSSAERTAHLVLVLRT